MRTTSKLRDALNDGGPREVVRRARLWSARQMYPGTMPEPKPRPPRKVAPQRATARTVGHQAAIAWFETRRATYERLADAVAPYVDPEGVVFDIGANIGYFTLVLAERTAFRGTVHLFEPLPNLSRLCAETLSVAPFTAHVHDYGLGAEEATATLYVGADGNLGWNTVVAAKATAGMQPVQIEIRDFARTGITDVPDFVKIDVEGAEHLVLAGLLPALASWDPKPVILCEVGWGTGHPDWEAELAAFGDLAALDYRSVDLNGDPIDVSTLSRTTDVLFLPHPV